MCGIISPLLYFCTDIYAGIVYPGYNFITQAISELFAIGSPVSFFVIPLFTITSLLSLMFSLGVWKSSKGNRDLKLTALMFAGNAVNGLILWNFFPMHMVGEETSFTDLMHILLAGVGVIFVLLAVLIVALSNHGRLRTYSILAIVVILVPGALVFMMIPGLTLGENSPYMGLTERIANYGYYIWQAIFIKHLMKSSN